MEINIAGCRKLARDSTFDSQQYEEMMAPEPEQEEVEPKLYRRIHTYWTINKVPLFHPLL